MSNKLEKICLRTLIFSIILTSCLVLSEVSCTVIPHNVKSKEVGFFGNEQNAGFLGFDEYGNGILTQRKVDEYNALILRFGNNTNKFLLNPGLNFGISPYTNNTMLINKEGLFLFNKMYLWYKEGE